MIESYRDKWGLQWDIETKGPWGAYENEAIWAARAVIDQMLEPVARDRHAAYLTLEHVGTLEDPLFDLSFTAVVMATWLWDTDEHRNLDIFIRAAARGCERHHD